MRRLALKSLLGHKLRAALTSIAIVLGVAMMSGTFVLTDQITSAFSSIFQSALKGTDVILSHRQAFTPQQGGGGDTGPLPASLIPKVRAVPGVANAEGQIQALGAIVVNGNVVTPSGGAPTLVLSTLPKPYNTNTLTAGHFPQGHGQIAVDTSLANDQHLHVGQRLGLTTDQGVKPVTVVGTFDFADSASLGGATLVSTTFSDAQRWYNRVGKTSVIVATADHGLSPVELKHRIIEAVPGFVKVQTGSESADQQSKDISNSIESFLTPLLLAFAIAAVFVGAFIIFNTFSITVAQRMREFAMVRTIGASRRQVLRTVLLEAFVIAVLSCIIGLVGGIFVAKLFNQLFKALGADLPLAGITIRTRTIVIPVIVGMSVTLLAALIPAFRATRVPPVAALREGATLPPSRIAKVVPYLAALFLIGGVAIVVQGFSSDAGAFSKILRLGLGSMIIFLGTAMLSKYLVRPLAKGIGWPLQKLAPGPGRLARENAMRNPGRTAITAAALMIGVALVVFVAVFVNGFKETFLGALDRSVSANLIITPRSQGQTMPPATVRTAATTPGVAVATGIGFTEVKINHGGTDVINGIDPGKLTQVYTFDWQKGGSNVLLTRLGTRGALVEEQFARSHHLGIGDTFMVTAATGRRMQLRVLGEYKDPVLFGGFMVANRTYIKLATDPGPGVVLVRYVPGVDPVSGEQTVKNALQAFPTAKVQTTQEYKDSVSNMLNRVLLLLYVLLAMVVVISLFGIVNTLALSVFERTREIGMLRAIGTTRSQLKRMIRLESVITAIIGGILGIVIGILLAWIVTQGLKDQGIVFAIPWGQMVACLIVAGLAGAAAAALPARRAAKLNVLDALQYE
ncbi:MAG TPA: FtsX-like permease family protein [Gaiellales bacterium]|nr:FtsX-like permease family protein [Gaiellales bacterium]